MFKRNEPDEEQTQRAAVTPEPAPAPKVLREAATIGPSICIRGDLTGEEDLVVQGRVEGTINLGQNLVTIGKDGHVNATVNARVINIEGEVEGDLRGNEQVVVRRSGNVRGNICSPRVMLEDGCRFKGSIDMDLGNAVDETRKIADIKPTPDKAAGDLN